MILLTASLALAQDVPVYAIDLGGDDWPNFAWADRDQDGDVDLAVSMAGDLGTVQVYDRTPAGLTLADSVTTNDLTSLVWLDLDGDGDLEIVTLVDTTSSAEVLDEDPGGYDVSQNLTAAYPAMDGVAADLDQDGDDDLVLATIDSSGWAMEQQAFRAEDGRLKHRWESTERWLSLGVDAGDLDGDGDLDLAFANVGSLGSYELKPGGNDHIYLNDGGAFSLGWTAPEDVPSLSVGWGDRDGDGDADLAFGGSDNVAGRIYDNVGGQLTLFAALPLSGENRALAWADVDGDLVAELAMATPTGPHVYDVRADPPVLLWSAPTEYVWDIAFVDWDGDGDLELAVATDEPWVQTHAHVEIFDLPFAVAPPADTSAPDDTAATDTGSPDTANPAPIAPTEPTSPTGCGCRTAPVGVAPWLLFLALGTTWRGRRR